MDIKKQDKGINIVNLFDESHSIDVSRAASVVRKYDTEAKRKGGKTFFQQINEFDSGEKEFSIADFDSEFLMDFFYTGYEVANKNNKKIKTLDEFLDEFAFLELLQWALYYIVEVYMPTTQISDETKKK